MSEMGARSSMGTYIEPAFEKTQEKAQNRELDEILHKPKTHGDSAPCKNEERQVWNDADRPEDEVAR